MEDLKSYNGKLVRIVDKDNNVFEGVCEYCGEDFNKAEFGITGESVDIINFKFTKNDISDITVIEEYSAPFSALEELNFEDGADGIADVLECEIDEHICRMLDYTLRKLKEGAELTGKKRLISTLEDLIEYSAPEIIKEKAHSVIEELNKGII